MIPVLWAMSLGLAAPELPLEPAPAPAQPEQPAPEPAAPADESTAPAVIEGTVTPDEGGPPYYSAADMTRLRQRHHLAEPTEAPRTARWRCLIADQTCSFNVEINALGAYAYRVRQDSVAEANQVSKWSSGRAQYDLWVNLPAVVETVGDRRYTRLTLGPKGGLIVSDTSAIWGNIGLALRYWVNRGRWSPTIEFTSALAFKVADATKGREFQTRRSPVGITADVGVGLGGFGAIVLGGQYDSPLAREDISDAHRTPSQGMFYLGFRGNIVWGGPAVVAFSTHALTQRLVQEP